MCYLLIERFSVCRCIYYQHAVDQCAAYNQAGHEIQVRTIDVGLTCELHTEPPQGAYGQQNYNYSDSGYHSSHSHKSSKSHRR